MNRLAGIASKETFNTPISQVVLLVFFGVNAKDDKWYLSKYFVLQITVDPTPNLRLNWFPYRKLKATRISEEVLVLNNLFLRYFRCRMLKSFYRLSLSL